MHVTFEWDGVQYRTDLEAHIVERQEVDGTWTRALTGRVIRSARMAVADWRREREKDQP